MVPGISLGKSPGLVEIGSSNIGSLLTDKSGLGATGAGCSACHLSIASTLASLSLAHSWIANFCSPVKSEPLTRLFNSLWR